MKKAKILLGIISVIAGVLALSGVLWIGPISNINPSDYSDRFICGYYLGG